jgi:hypothetical protein
MTISSLSLTFVRYDNTADMMRARGAAKPLPDAKLAPTKAPCGDHGGCDGPRPSPLYRALMGALSSLVEQPPTKTTTPTSAPASPTGVKPAVEASQAAAAAGTDPIADGASESAGAPVDLDEALMNFAHALMQALRGGRPAGQDSGEREGRGHRHHDHDHHHHHRRGYGRAAWGDPAQRVAQLGEQMRPTAPSPVATARTGATDASSAAPSAPAEFDQPATTPAITPAADSVVDPVETIEPAAAGPAPASPLAVNLNIYVAVPWASPTHDPEPGLFDAFGTLQQARGLPPSDRPSLKEKLSAFLQALAERLRDGDALTNDMTRAGAMLSVTA